MSSKTKIVVLRQKHLFAGIIAIIALAAVLILYFMNSSDSTQPTSLPTGSDAIYKAGVYTTSVIINGSPMDIRVTLDQNNINDIQLLNVSDTITTMYPLIEDSFANIRNQIIETGSVDNISFDTQNTYSSTTIINAIKIAINKGRIQ